jgi:predicted Fe-Mo cluster-binding NifX family protein
MIGIAVPEVENKGLDSMVSPNSVGSPRVLVDSEELRVETVRTAPNPHYYQHQPGPMPGLVCSQQVEVMLTGGIEGHTIQAVTADRGTVRHTLEQYVGYRLEEAEPCRESVERAGIE